jgi:hypothetical protein
MNHSDLVSQKASSAEAEALFEVQRASALAAFAHIS